jgi:hypothetical protein
VSLFSDVGVLQEVISEDTCAAVECLQCVKWRVGSCRITVIAYKDNVNGVSDGDDERDKFFCFQNKGLFQERYGCREWMD